MFGKLKQLPLQSSFDLYRIRYSGFQNSYRLSV